MTVQIKLDATRSFFEAEVDGKHAGQLEFVRRDGVIAYTHTEVEPEFQGRGVGGSLVKEALDAARAEGVRVRPVCPFVKDWIERHPDYKDLVRINASHPGGRPKS